jgi:imidazolonepropionase
MKHREPEMDESAGRARRGVARAAEETEPGSPPPVRPLLVVGAGQLLTLDGSLAPRRGPAMRDLGIIEDGAVLIRGGGIAATGRGANLLKYMKRARRQFDVLDAGGRVVMPAFVDSHTHLAFAEPRLADFEMRVAGAAYEQIARAGGGIHSSVERLRSAGRRNLLSSIIYFAQTAITYGTATIEVKSGYGLDLKSELMLLESVRAAAGLVAAELVPTFLGAHVVPRGVRRRAYVRTVIEEMLPRVARDRLAEFCDVFCDRLAFTVSDAEKILTAAAGHGMKARLHGEQLARTGAALLAVRLGAASVDHLERAGPREIAALAGSNTIATLLPGATYFLGRAGYAPARALIDGGAAVALATDFNPGTCPTLNMQMVLSLGCTQMRMSPAEAITAATTNAAFALDRGCRLGMLKRGMQADLAVFDVRDYREIPYFFGMNHCWATIKRGRVVWRRGGARVEDGRAVDLPR